MLETSGKSLKLAQNTILGFDTEIKGLSQDSPAPKSEFASELSRATETIDSKLTETSEAALKLVAIAKPEVPEKSALAEPVSEDKESPNDLSRHKFSSSRSALTIPVSSQVDKQSTISVEGLVQASSDPVKSVHATGLPEIEANTVESTTSSGSSDDLLQGDNSSVKRLNSGFESLNSEQEQISPPEQHSFASPEIGVAQKDNSSKVLLSGKLHSFDNIGSLNTTQVNGSFTRYAVGEESVDGADANGSTPIRAMLVPDEGNIDIQNGVNGAMVSGRSLDVADPEPAGPSKAAVAKVISDPEYPSKIASSATFPATYVGAHKSVNGGSNIDLLEGVNKAVQGSNKEIPEPQPNNATISRTTLIETNESGLRTLHTQINNSVSLASQTVTSAMDRQALGITTVSVARALNSDQAANSGSVVSVMASANTDEAGIVSGHEFLRTMGRAQEPIADRLLSKPEQMTMPDSIPDEQKKSVSMQSQTIVVTPIGQTTNSQQARLLEPVMLNRSAKVTPEGVTVTRVEGSSTAWIGTTQRDTLSGVEKPANAESGSAALQRPDRPTVGNTLAPTGGVVEPQHKLAEATSTIKSGDAHKIQQNSAIASPQIPNRGPDVTSDNMYYPASNGTISANLPPLNTGLSVNSPSAPSTLILNQPGADQVMTDNLRWAINEKLSRVTINVTPANLGPISVSVDVENQNMNVSIITNSAFAKEAIDSLLPRMREHFANEGYQQVSVDVSSQQERQSTLRNQSGQPFEQEGGKESDSSDNDSANDSSQESQVPNGRLSLEQQRTSNSLIDTYV